MTFPQPPAIAALGGGHGLAASLRALRTLTARLTAVVTVADDGGSSGRLRRELDLLPPGDLRMALCALASDPLWRDVAQHRFSGDGCLDGHAVGNLLLAGLVGVLNGDVVAALDRLGALLGLPDGTRVLPMCCEPLEISARVRGADGTERTESGQLAVATTRGRVLRVALHPARPQACAEAVAAVRAADAVVLGPGSLFTSVLPHLLVPGLGEAVLTARRRILVQNLAPQAGETAGFTPAAHLRALAEAVPDLRLDVVIADPSTDVAELSRAAAAVGAELLVTEVADRVRREVHDSDRLAGALARAVGGHMQRERR